MRPIHAFSSVMMFPACAFGAVKLRDDLGGLNMSVGGVNLLGERYFNQGLRWLSAFKFKEASESFQYGHLAAPGCAMCHWGAALARGQNLNDGLVQIWEPEFLAQEPMAYTGVDRARQVLPATPEAPPTTLPMGSPAYGGTLERDRALVEALSRRYVPTLKEYLNEFDENNLPTLLNENYADAMRKVRARWPRDPMVATLTADALMNLSPWNYWLNSSTMRPSAAEAKEALESVIAAPDGTDPDNQWAIHLYIHLLEASEIAGDALPYADKLADLAPGAGHLVHMPSHTYFRVGAWKKAVDTNYRAMDTPIRNQAYPEHNMDMGVWALRAEGRSREAVDLAGELTKYSRPLVQKGDLMPLLPHERFGPALALTLLAFGRFQEVTELPSPPENAPFWRAMHHFALSVSFAALGQCAEATAQRLLLAGLGPEVQSQPAPVYGIYRASSYLEIATYLARAEALRYENLVGCIDRKSAATVAEAAARAGKDLAKGEAFTGAARMGPAAAAMAGEDAAEAAQGDQDEVALLQKAVALETETGYDEPPTVYLPTQFFLGAALLRRNASGDAQAAMEAYKNASYWHPNIGWALFGMAEAAERLGDTTAAKDYHAQFKAAWKRADVTLLDSAHPEVHLRTAAQLVRLRGANLGGVKQTPLYLLSASATVLLAAAAAARWWQQRRQAARRGAAQEPGEETPLSGAMGRISAPTTTKDTIQVTL